MCVCVVLSFMLLYVHRNHKAYQGRGAQDGHLVFHTAVKSVCVVIVCWVMSLWWNTTLKVLFAEIYVNVVFVRS